MKTTFDLPDTLLRRAKALAAEQGRPLRDLVAEALTEKLGSPRTPVGKHPSGRREGHRETWEEYRSRFELQPDGTYRNMDAIDDESFYRALEEIRRRPFERRDPFADQK
jgi:hypothetical protein